MNWDVTERSANSNVESNPLTITGIKEKKVDSWDCYSIEVEENITYWKKFGVEKTTKKEIITFLNTYKNRDLLSDDKSDAFYYFAYHYRKKTSTKFPLEGHWFNKEFVNGPAETVFCLSEKANEIIKEEKKRWDNAKLTTAEDLKIENISFVDTKWDALEKDIDGNNWNPSLNEEEKKLVDEAKTAEEIHGAQRKIALLRGQKQLLNVKKKDLNIHLADFRAELGIKESDLQTKFSHNYQQILDDSLTLNNLEQLENTVQAVICICATEIVSHETDNNKKVNPDEIRVLLTHLNLIKTAWGQTALEISKENNPLYLEIIDRQSEYRQKVEDLIKDLQKSTPSQNSLDEIIEQAKKAKSIVELEASINSLDFYRNSQDEEIKNIYGQRKQEVDDLRNLLALKLQLVQQVENAQDISQDSKDAEENIFERRRLVRVSLENFAESTSPEAKQAYQEINEDGKVANGIESLAKKLWDHLEGYEKRANDPSNKELLQALTERGITEGTSRYKLFWLAQGIAKEFAKAHLDGKVMDVYPYVTVPSGGHTNWKGGIMGSEGFDLNLEFVKEPELRIPISLVHELSHDVVFLKEHKKILPFHQSHSKTFWEGLFMDSDSTFTYLISCLPSERQKELRVTTDVLNNSKATDSYITYFPNTDKLEGKRRLKKYFKDEVVNKEWNSVRQKALSLVDNSMNEGDKIKKWRDRSELNKRWIWTEVLHKLKKPKEGDVHKKQEHKVYVFYDSGIIVSELRDQIEEEFSFEKGWEGEVISTDKAPTMSFRLEKLGGCFKCGCDINKKVSEEVQQEAKIIHNPLENPNK